MPKVDLNCDMGESYGKACSYDELIMPNISSCNIACGFHSGDPVTIEKTIKLALEHGVAIGAHPGYPDLQGFGRREMQMHPKDLEANVRYQVSALKGITEALGGTLHHVKPHGALYNAAAKSYEVAEAVLRGISSVDDKVWVFGLAGSKMEEKILEFGLPYQSEVFADRRYEDDLQLRSRLLDGAVLHDEATVLNQIEQMVLHGQVETHSGAFKSLQADSICLHSDTMGAAALSKSIHDFLIAKGVEIAAA